MPTDSTYYTIANAPFFPGLVALLNSLRLSGNRGELVVLDRGLEEEQRELLAPHATVVQLPDEHVSHPALLKPYAQALDPKGVVILLDSDMMVVRSLDWIVEQAAAGRICLFPDPIPDRWFAEWADTLELSAPLRRGTYLNAGFVAFDVERWPSLLSRWWELCAKIPADQLYTDQAVPFWAADQDALNALLFSELPEEAVEELPDPRRSVSGAAPARAGARPSGRWRASSTVSRRRSCTTRSAPRPGSASAGSGYATTPMCGYFRGCCSPTT